MGETVPEVFASDGTQTEVTVSTNTDLPRPMNNIFFFFLLRFKSFRKIFLHFPTYRIEWDQETIKGTERASSIYTLFHR